MSARAPGWPARHDREIMSSMFDWMHGLPEDLIVWVGMLPVILVSAGGMLYVSTRERARGAMWAAFARERGGRFQPSALYRVSDARIDLEARGVAVHVALEVRGTGQPRASHAYAAWALGSGPSFRITPEHALSGLDKRLGQEDHTLGDPRFDRAFLVGGSSAPILRLLLTPPLRQELMAHLRLAIVASDGSTVTVSYPGTLVEPSVLRAMVDVAAGIASYGLEELAALAAIPGARWEPPSGAWDERTPARLEVERRGVATVISLRPTERGLRAELAVSSPRTLPTIAVRIDAAGTVQGDAPPGALPPPRELVPLAGASLSASGAAARLRFEPGRIPSVAAVEAGAELLASLVRGPGSAFR